MLSNNSVVLNFLREDIFMNSLNFRVHVISQLKVISKVIAQLKRKKSAKIIYYETRRCI